MSAGAVWAVCWQGNSSTLVFISQYLVLMVLEKKFFFFLAQAEWLFLFLTATLPRAALSKDRTGEGRGERWLPEALPDVC